MVLAQQPRRSVMGDWIYIVPATHDEVNVQQLRGTEEVLTALVKEHKLLAVSTEDQEGMDAHKGNGRGRKPGSTNWSQERYFRKYAKAAGRLERPYKRTHLAAQMGIVYDTFRRYFERWGPPPGVAAPGD